MKIVLSGALGHMGAEVVKLTQAGCRGIETVAGVDANARAEGVQTDFPTVAKFEELSKVTDLSEIGAIVDFSHHSLTADMTAFAVKNSIPLVVATTGQTEEERAMIKEAAKSIPIFFAANYSLGIALLIELAKKTAAAMPDAEIEIIEKHHDRKLDAPSGTALAIANAIKEVRPEAEFNLGRSGNGKRTPQEIGIHAIRMGNIVGEHEVMIGTNNQTITLKHEAHSRALFAEGALAAAQFLEGKPAGLYQMTDLVR